MSDADPGEDEATALARELVEELGVTPTQVDEVPVARVVLADLRLAHSSYGELIGRVLAG